MDRLATHTELPPWSTELRTHSPSCRALHRPGLRVMSDTPLSAFALYWILDGGNVQEV